MKLRELREARALIALATLGDERDGPSMSYYALAEKNGLPRSAADRADQIWNSADNGPIDIMDAEENAMELVQSLIETARGK